MKAHSAVMALLLPLSAPLHSETITGKIVNTNGVGLPGLNVALFVTPPGTYTTSSGLDGSFAFGIVTGVAAAEHPASFWVSECYPNPFNPSTRVAVHLTKTSRVRFELFTLVGQHVKTVIDRTMNAGTNCVELELQGYANGIYLARVFVDREAVATRKLLLIYGTKHSDLKNTASEWQLRQLQSSGPQCVLAQHGQLDSIVVSWSPGGRKSFRGLPAVSGDSVDVGHLVLETSSLTGSAYFAGTTMPIQGIVTKIDDQKDTSGSDGRFYLSNLVPGTRILSAIKSGYEQYSEAIDIGEGPNFKNIQMTSTLFPHTAGWLEASEPAFHGKFLRLGFGTPADCAPCHGADFAGGSSGQSCYTCHAPYPHKVEWLVPASAASHGRYLKARLWLRAECVNCHGSDFTGEGDASMSCFRCHTSYPHTLFVPVSGHAGYLASSGYPLNDCKRCHGANYGGGSVVNCNCTQRGCHVDYSGAPKSPEACNTCHGQFRAAAGDALSAAPPMSVMGDSLTGDRGVGAHAKHLVSGSVGKMLKCAECHAVPATFFSSGHVDTQRPAEVVFADSLARLITGSGTYIPAAAYTSTTVTCASTYCHGNWQLTRAGSAYPYIFTDSVMVGNTTNQVTWTGGSLEPACTSCHGLPPAGHMPFPLQSCVNCHAGVLNGSGQIINQVMHVNGKANVFSTERSF